VRDRYATSSRRATLLAAVRRSIPLVAGLALLGAVVGGLLGYRQAERHVADSAVLVTPLDGNPFNPTGNGDDLLNLETEAQLAASDAVGRQVADRVGGDVTADDVLQGLSVEVPPNTQILRLSYVSPSEDDAVERAQAFAEEYLAYRTERAESLLTQRQDRTQAQIDNQNERLERLVSQLEGTQDAARRSLLQSQVDGVTEQIGQLQTQLVQLASGAVDPGQVITPATGSGGGQVLTPVLYAGVGLVAGALAGLAVVVVRTRGEQRVHHVDDIEDSGLTVLGRLSPGELRQAAKAAKANGTALTSALTDDLRELRAALLTREQRRPFSLMVAVASEEMGAPASPLGLGLAAAVAQVPTILVDATSRAVSTTTLLGARGRPGLADALAGEAEVADALVPVRDHLQLLPIGSRVQRLEDLLASPMMRRVLAECASRADLVILSVGAIDTAAARSLAALTDVQVVEAGQGVVRVSDVSEVASAAESLGDSFLGVVFVDRDSSSRRTPNVPS
jgi:Mrp family chromosome partitioning ATPase/capsular polysaccharide biosynthesis protein